jgi:hypothetical protein
MLDMDRETAVAVLEFKRTAVGELLENYCNTLIEDRKDRILGHRGVQSIPDVWHDQGFVDGIRHVALLFSHALFIAEEAEKEEAKDPNNRLGEYTGASPDNPRR